MSDPPHTHLLTDHTIIIHTATHMCVYVARTSSHQFTQSVTCPVPYLSLRTAVVTPNEALDCLQKSGRIPAHLISQGQTMPRRAMSASSRPHHHSANANTNTNTNAAAAATARRAHRRVGLLLLLLLVGWCDGRHPTSSTKPPWDGKPALGGLFGW
mmetsp:Transcript_6873/g.19969  ORF Transcript_6873/g.19969 Transcript_6873/m.19969 type:complete len:156 (+) Transcript_6873:121-588(+)